MKKAIREALCNTLSNADYHGELGLVIKQYHDKLVFSNPGVLAIPLNKILLGGTSKARNRTILNIFSYVNIGERAGSGYPLILNATKEGNYPTPELYDEFNPDGTKLIIFIKKIILQDEKPDVGVEKPDVGGERPDVGAGRPDIGVEKPDIGVEKPDVEAQRPDIPSLINIIDCSNNIKTNLLIIYKKLGNTIYSRSDVVKVTFSGKSQASLYIKLLKDNGLIEPVIGYGKGKYKFK